MIKLSEFHAVTFDVYGTLIDWEPQIVAFLGKWAGENGLSESGGDLIMAFDRARAEIQKERPAHLYPEVLKRCFARISKDYGVTLDERTQAEFSKTPHSWPAYADAAEGLAFLQTRAKVGALSNIDNSSLMSSCDKMRFRFDFTVTAEQVGAYKPDWPHFHTAIRELESLGIHKHRILHVGQSLRADITPANKLGITSAWVNRPDRLLGLSGDGAAEARPDLTVSSLAELVTAIR